MFKTCIYSTLRLGLAHDFSTCSLLSQCKRRTSARWRSLLYGSHNFVVVVAVCIFIYFFKRHFGVKTKTKLNGNNSCEMYKSTLARSPFSEFLCVSLLSLSLFPCLPLFYTWTRSSGRSVKTTWKCILITYVLVATPTNVEMSLFNLMCLNQQKYAIKWESGQRRCRLKSVPESPLKWARPSRTDRQIDRGNWGDGQLDSLSFLCAFI